MLTKQLTTEQAALGSLFLWVEQRAEYLRKQKAASVTRQDDSEAATNTNHVNATGKGDDTTRPETEQSK